jgi:hypothetical protein
MWITIGIIAIIILALIVLWFVNSPPKPTSDKYETNPTRLQAQSTKDDIRTEITNGQTAPSEPRRKRTIKEIKEEILKEQ